MSKYFHSWGSFTLMKWSRIVEVCLSSMMIKCSKRLSHRHEYLHVIFQYHWDTLSKKCERMINVLKLIFLMLSSSKFWNYVGWCSINLSFKWFRGFPWKPNVTTILELPLSSNLMVIFSKRMVPFLSSIGKTRSLSPIETPLEVNNTSTLGGSWQSYGSWTLD